MSDLALILAHTLADVAAGLADLADTMQGSAASAALRDLAAIGVPPRATAFQRAVAQATAQLRQAHPEAAGPLLTLLADQRPPVATFRAFALAELLLAARPDFARLADRYRRELRATEAGANLPPWTRIGPALIHFLADLLPAAMADQPRLRRSLPDSTSRAALDELRADQRPALPALLEQLAGPTFVASNGASISHVRQTIVHGDYYAAPASAEPDLAWLFVRYRAFVVESFGALDFRGMLQIQSATRIGLEQIYIPLSARPLSGVNTESAGAARPLHDFICQMPLLVVLGDPGSGKSTLVRYIVLTLARGEAIDRLGLDPIWLPIVFPVAAFAAARAQPGQADLSPLAYLSEYYKGLSQPDYGPLFQRALSLGRALVLLDGLDEVRSDRPGMVRCLEAFVREWDGPGNRFLATSRIVGYAETPLDPTLFAGAQIQPLDDEQIHYFIERWSRAYATLAEPTIVSNGDLLHDLVRAASTAETERRIARHSSALAEAVFAEPNVTALARTPLLLTILALVHNQGARLPDRRVDLYRLCIEALAETWNRARSLSGRPILVQIGDQQIDDRFVINLLGPVALWIHAEQPGGLVDHDDLEARIAATLVQTEGLTRTRARRMAQDFIELMRRDTGLLQERGYRRFGFLHLTFEEYLAARGLLESVAVSDPDGLFHRYCIEPRWREVLRLAVAAAPQREAQRLLLHMLEAPVAEANRGRPVVLAGECLVDIGRSGATGRAWSAVSDALITVVADRHISLSIRTTAGSILGQLGDPRRLDPQTGRAAGTDEHPVADFWCPIEAGPFWHGDERSRRGRSAPLRQVELCHSFRIARYPVTNAEYRAFVAAGGYNERRWWTTEGWKYLVEGGYSSALDSDGGPLNGPGLWGTPQYSSPAQPVVGVSWYEASAYCAWLTDQGHAAGWLPAGAVLRLPTALEWERAARHTDQRRYPWGDELPDSERANYEGAGLRAPTPVGSFPAGAAACGALDLAGNVWEWTSSLADTLDEIKPRSDISRKEQPVIRGGAFNWEADYLRCSAHYWFNPGQRHNLLGFRVVWVEAI